MGVVSNLSSDVNCLNPEWRDVDDYKLLEKNFETAIDLPNFKMTDEDDDNENKEELK